MEKMKERERGGGRKSRKTGEGGKEDRGMGGVLRDRSPVPWESESSVSFVYVGGESGGRQSYADWISFLSDFHWRGGKEEKKEGEGGQDGESGENGKRLTL